MKYIWIIHYVAQHDIMAAEDIETAYKIMRSYVKSIGELNVPSGRTNATIMDEVLDELYSHYSQCKEDEGSGFGLENICSAEEVPLYDHWRGE